MEGGQGKAGRMASWEVGMSRWQGGRPKEAHLTRQAGQDKRSWFGHCASSREVLGSIPNGIEFFH